MKKLSHFNLLKRGHGLRYEDRVDPGDPEGGDSRAPEGEHASPRGPHKKLTKAGLFAIAVIAVGVGAWLYFRPGSPSPRVKIASSNQPGVSARIQKPFKETAPAPGSTESAPGSPKKTSPGETIERIPIEPLPPEKPAAAPPSLSTQPMRGKRSPRVQVTKESQASIKPPGKTVSPSLETPASKAVSPPKLRTSSKTTPQRAKTTVREQKPPPRAYQVEVASCVTGACRRRTERQIHRAGYKSRRTKVERKVEMYLVVNGGFLTPARARQHQQVLERKGVKVSLHSVEDGKQVVAAGIFARLQDARSFRARLPGRSGRWRIVRRPIPVVLMRFVVGGFQSYQQAVKAKSRLFAEGFQPLIRRTRK